jgi:hypothetical protein
MTDDTHIAGPRHSPVLAFLAGFAQPPLYFVGFFGAWALTLYSMLWALILAVAAGVIVGGLNYYNEVITDIKNAKLSYHVAYAVGLIATEVFLIFGSSLFLGEQNILSRWITIQNNQVPVLMRFLPPLLFFPVDTLSKLYLWRSLWRKPEQTSAEQEHQP